MAGIRAASTFFWMALKSALMTRSGVLPAFKNSASSSLLESLRLNQADSLSKWEAAAAAAVASILVLVAMT